MFQSPAKQVEATQENLIDAFFTAAVRGVLKRFNIKEIDVKINYETRTVNVTADISREKEMEVAQALEEAVGRSTD